MKTLGRVLIILAVFVALSGLMILAVNASGSTTVFASEGVSSQVHSDGARGGVRPEGGEFRPEHGGRGGGGMFGLVKNIGVMAALVIMIALPKSLAKNKRKQAAINQA